MSGLQVSSDKIPRFLKPEQNLMHFNIDGCHFPIDDCQIAKHHSNEAIGHLPESASTSAVVNVLEGSLSLFLSLSFCLGLGLPSQGS